jgi:dolichol-phosphate mannosyltransferase
VDDGSRDATAAVIEDWHRRDSRIVGIRLSRNFGHQAALSAGLTCAHADYVGVMDCDMQDPIEVLIQLYRACVREELDVCYGIRAKRDAPMLLRVAYSLFYRLINKTADHQWPRDAGDFCVMSARCQKTLLALPEQSRMLRGLRSWVGFRQTGIAYDRPARLHGSSKYNLPRLVALALQGLIAFSHVPLRLATIMGAAMGVLSLLFGAVILLNRLFPQLTVFGYWIGASPGIATLVVFLAFTLSVLFLCLGIVGEYLIVMMQEIKRRPAAIIASRIGDVRQHHSSYSLFAAVERELETAEAR